MEFDTGLSLTVIITVLGITVIASLLSPRGKAQAVTSAARHDAYNYLNPGYTADDRERNRIYARLVREEQQIHRFGPRHRQAAKDEQDLMNLIAQAHRLHDAKTLGHDPPEENLADGPREGGG